ncbi:MAG: DUF4158 domain-containing protein [Pseudonocardia sp.]
MPDEVTAAPAVAVQRLAARLGIAEAALAGYGRREQTRTDHLRVVMAYRGWRSAEELSLKSLTSFCWLGRWSTTRRPCCFGWRVSI